MSGVREVGLAVGCFTALALLLVGPALHGTVWLAPDTLLANDPLYRTDAGAPALVGGDHTLVAADLPRDLTIARALRDGRLAKWNPLSACGAPLWAEQGAPFFPLKAVLLLDPSRRGYVVFLALRLIVAACGAYVLARYRGLSPTGALAAGALFELSGPMVQQLQFGSASATCMLPWALCGAEALARAPRERPIGGSGLALGLAGLGGHPTVAAAVYAGFAAGIAGAVVARLREPRVALAIAAGGIAAMLIGVALAGPALLPLAELLTVGSSYKTRELGELFWAGALDRARALAVPALLAPHLGDSMYGGAGPFYARAATLGLAGSVLSLAGLVVGGLSPVTAGVAVLGVALTLGVPGLAWLNTLPGMHFILPQYAWVLVALPLTQAAGAAVDGFASTVVRRAAWLMAALVCCGAALLWWRGASGVFLPQLGASLAESFERARAAPGAHARLWLPPALLLVALAATTLAPRRLHRWCGAGLALLAVLELVLLWRPMLQHVPATLDAAAPPPAVQALRAGLADGGGRMSGYPFAVGTPLTPMQFGLADVRGLSALPVERYLRYLNLIDPNGSAATAQQVAPTYSPLLDLAAMRYLVVPSGDQTPAEQLAGDPRTALLLATPAVAIYENRAALPRARIVHRDRRVADVEAAGAALRELAGGAPHVGDGALRDVVVLEPDASGAWPPPRPDEDVAGGDSVRIVDHGDSDRLVLDAELEQPGWVVVADTYYPGWTAAVDGAPAPIHPANGMFRAVHVPAGRHTIEMRYAPASFRWGVAAFVAGAMVCALLLRRRPPGTSTAAAPAPSPHPTSAAA